MEYTIYTKKKNNKTWVKTFTYPMEEIQAKEWEQTFKSRGLDVKLVLATVGKYYDSREVNKKEINN
jgi:hypothetical protein